ncbi:hypothetical protein MRX96_003057 [Rhipicephalus microplus]
MEDNVKRWFSKAHPALFTMIDPVHEELLRMDQVEVTRPNRSLEWTVPIVPIMKRSGQIQIYGNFKVTVITMTTPAKCPIPRVGDLFSHVSGGMMF